jgi:iron(III) transport system permease protein
VAALLNTRDLTSAPTDAPGGRRRKRDLSLTVAIAICVLFVVVGAAFPTGKVLAAALSRQAWPMYTEFVRSPVDRQIFLNTIYLGLLVGALATAIGFLFAYVQTRLDVPFRRALHVMALVPMVSPPFAVATAAIVLYGRRGLVTHRWLGLDYDIYGLDGLVLVQSLTLFPFAYLTLVGMIRALDPAMEESAMVMGARRGQLFRTIQLPLLAPGLVGPFLLLFVEAIADLANPLTIGGDYTVLASRAYLAVIGEYNMTAAAVYSAILLVPSVGLFIAQRWWLARKERNTITGRPSGTVHLIQSWVRWPVWAAAVLVSLLTLSLYLTVIVGAFVRLFGIDNSFTLDNFKEVLVGVGREAVKDTTVLALVATPLAGVLGLVIGWVVVRHLRRSAGWLDFGATLGAAIPGTVLGIGYLMAYNLPRWAGPIPVLPKLVGGSALFGGALAIVVAYTTRGVPFGLRNATAAMAQLDAHVEEASTSLGAKPFQTFRMVTLPLIRPALLTGLSYSFARCMTSVSTIVFLTTPDTKIITQQILNAAQLGRYGVAFAYCTVLTVIVLLAFAVIRLLVGSGATLHRVADTPGGRKK